MEGGKSQLVQHILINTQHHIRQSNLFRSATIVNTARPLLFPTVQPKPLWYHAARSMIFCYRDQDESRRDYIFWCLMNCYLNDILHPYIGLTRVILTGLFTFDLKEAFTQTHRKDFKKHANFGWDMVCREWADVTVTFIVANLYEKGIELERDCTMHNKPVHNYKICCGLYHNQIVNE